MKLTPLGMICERCDAMLAPRGGGGQPIRPRWPGYEVPVTAPDGLTYLQTRCARCDGPPPTTRRQWLALAPCYAAGLGLALWAVAGVGVVPPLQVVGRLLIAAAVLAVTSRHRWRWRIRGRP